MVIKTIPKQPKYVAFSEVSPGEVFVFKDKIKNGSQLMLKVPPIGQESFDMNAITLDETYEDCKHIVHYILDDSTVQILRYEISVYED